MFAKPVEL